VRRRGGPEFDCREGFREFIDDNIEAEALGFHSTFVVEHHVTAYGQVSAMLNLLTWLGARTRWRRLGTAVLVLPWHNPVLVAEQAATLDLLSGGRLDFGIGKGYRDNEFAGFCVPMEEADARFDECLEVILKAWTADEPFSHRGQYWAFDQIVVEPPPALVGGDLSGSAQDHDADGCAARSNGTRRAERTDRLGHRRQLSPHGHVPISHAPTHRGGTDQLSGCPAMAQCPEHRDAVRSLALNPVRPHRVEPRVKKRRPKRFPLMCKPRQALRHQILQRELRS
jgi:hypothetical protein